MVVAEGRVFGRAVRCAAGGRAAFGAARGANGKDA
jgi:hypothetical protein